MPKKQNPMQERKGKAKNQINLNTGGKNAAGQTNGHFEQDPKRRQGSFTGTGEAPRMHK